MAAKSHCRCADSTNCNKCINYGKERELLEKLNLWSQQAMTVAHIVEFTGNHVNNKLHKHLEDHHMRELSTLIESEKMDFTTQTTLSSLYKSACRHYSYAKVSCSFIWRHAGKRASKFWCSLWKIWPQAEEGMDLWSCLSQGHGVCHLPAVTWLHQHCQCWFQLGWCFSWLVWSQQQNLPLHQLCQQKSPLPLWKGGVHHCDVSHIYCQFLRKSTSHKRPRWWADPSK